MWILLGQETKAADKGRWGWQSLEKTIMQDLCCFCVSQAKEKWFELHTTKKTYWILFFFFPFTQNWIVQMYNDLETGLPSKFKRQNINTSQCIFWRCEPNSVTTAYLYFSFYSHALHHSSQSTSISQKHLYKSKLWITFLFLELKGVVKKVKKKIIIGTLMRRKKIT